MNYLYNLAIASLGSLVVYLLQGFVAFQIYAQAPWPAKFLSATVVTFMLFAIIMKLKYKYENRSWFKKLEPVVKVVFGFMDVEFNVCFGSIVFMQAANHNGEGWLLTSRLRYLIDVGEFEIGEGIKPDWRYYRAVQIGKLVDSADPTKKSHTGRTL